MKQNAHEQPIESDIPHKSSEQEHERPEPKQSKRESPDTRAQKERSNADDQSSTSMYVRT